MRAESKQPAPKPPASSILEPTSYFIPSTNPCVTTAPNSFPPPKHALQQPEAHSGGNARIWLMMFVVLRPCPYISHAHDVKTTTHNTRRLEDKRAQDRHGCVRGNSRCAGTFRALLAWRRIPAGAQRPRRSRSRARPGRCGAGS
eukprot:1911354-Rhodomonas_salina.2